MFKMWSCYIIILVSLVYAAKSVYLNAEHPQVGDNNKDVHHFTVQADDQSSVVNLSNSTCIDPRYFCSQNLTCCNSVDRRIISCCPIPQGVCCLDGKHCCPPKTQCDMIKQQCYYMQTSHGHKLFTADWFSLDDNQLHKNGIQDPSLDMSPSGLSSSVCIGGEVECANGQTCCPDTSGSVTCCPESDPRDPANNVRASLLCRDGSECPSGSSCCEISVGQYGCCPQEKAICCLDQIHCCPEDYICDLGAGACLKGNTYVKWLTKQPAEHLAQNSVVCPGGWSQCPDGTTCCKMQTGEYGCCPYQKAVCCSDGIHCCPEGYTCNVAAGFCARKNEVINWKSKVESVHLKSSSHTCNDPGCPRRSTCCELATGQHGCCPLEQAVCCSDQIHCCPRGYKCDVSKGTCTLGSKASTWLTKVLSAPAETEV